MKRTVVAGFLLVILVEAWSVALPDRSLVGWAAGAALAILLLAMRWSLRSDDEADDRWSSSDDAAELLAQWRAETETLIRRADSTRLQWDRHLRPRLAREFAAATGHRQAGDPAAFHATGRMLFGEQLWQWVDPNNVATSAGRADEPGPGRAVLGEILERLERL
ncbi:hypothetical protein H7J87_30680 [Mycolicibacterium wolinskyi]|uniref:Uncharacterized protein n=1 Tax=Mycolicibacterium wolinskyi TaxID=59750 RepID=A0A132PI00_9MYCO|nr:MULTISPECIES: hypothetical protein [Mycolicibacterium]KWX21988.1 hypothetical protein AFM11_22795 [Mycolicibacterium wolinskyi]MCV7289695.1 hypothetical protein [Mycolicibacterium wolinskyi]MCV7296666.1 hypothetical protein [Mycolicibacterium goodii]ORX10181.1 hypothetical protein AWC31_08405 [Mycolicibacterium wolinskyi]